MLFRSDTGDGKNIKVWDVDGEKLKKGREFASMKLDGFDKPGNADGIRADIDGNIWASAGWVGDGYDGVHVFAPNGDRIGQIDPGPGVEVAILSAVVAEPLVAVQVPLVAETREAGDEVAVLPPVSGG